MKLPLPACDAVMVVDPTPTIVIVDPETVATDVFELVYVTANPELADAVKLKFAPP